ncbi:MAG: undecaprenyldiphospho-muramoylpentapeptide beta-N-acetylglucosaminyltransferase [Treponemataceae bacterium]|nr:MAG: undecaprenyldiphospho-muramoylpentapeptide beta-N-acetylglucosaminyltransferase [Treponemataceae bacterium]
MPSDRAPRCICYAFTGGGTGGHIFPGLAVAGEFRKKITDGASSARRPPSAARIVWIGSSRGMDRDLVEKSGKADRFYGIPSGKLRRYISFRTIPDIFRVLAGFFSAVFLLVKLKPAFLFSKGGYVSVPPCFAAKLLGIPVFTHECDFSPGLATRLNSRAASRVFVSYEGTRDFFPVDARERIVVTGNPVRAEFYEADALRGRELLGIPAAPSKPVLLALGGSSGSQQINALVRETLPRLTEHFVVIHQTGYNTENDAPFAHCLSDAGHSYIAFPFIHEGMCDVIAASDVVVSRAGANSLSECAALKKPLVLIPLSGAGTRGDQVENAEFYAKNNAAIALSGGVTAQAFTAALETMLDAAKRAEFSRNIAALAGDKRPAKVIAEILCGAEKGTKV